MGNLSLKEKQNFCMAEKVLVLKNTLKRWYNHAGIRYLKEHQLTDEQEVLLEDFTDFITESIDNLEEDNSFLRKIILPPVQIKKKKSVEA